MADRLPIEANTCLKFAFLRSLSAIVLTTADVFAVFFYPALMLPCEPLREPFSSTVAPDPGALQLALTLSLVLLPFHRASS